MVVLLFLAVLVAQWDGGNPVRWAGESVNKALALVGALGDQIGPDVMVVMTPVVAAAADSESADQADPVAAAADSESADQADPVAAVADSESADQADPVAVMAAPAAAVQVSTAAVLRTDMAPLESTATEAGLAATPLPASTPAASATPPPVAAAVTAVGITATAPSSLSALPTATPIVTNTTQATPLAPGLPATTRGGIVASIVGITQQPSATVTSPSAPVVTPSSTPPAAASQTTYKIRPGDTLVVIASRFDVAVDDLMAANSLSANDVFTIQPGQTLIIPPAEGTVAASPASSPTTTATATAQATATPLPSPSPSPTQGAPTPTVGWRLDAPVLRSPESGTPVSCGAPDNLVWMPVPFMASTEVYVMHLGYVNGRAADGTEQIMWVLEQPRPANTTSWEMDGDVLCGLAPQEYGRQWRWYVQVAAQTDGTLTPVSPPSNVWGFAWN